MAGIHKVINGSEAFYSSFVNFYWNKQDDELNIQKYLSGNAVDEFCFCRINVSVIIRQTQVKESISES